MKQTKKPELLSPAGSMDALKQAVHNGADAIYLGGTHFGARAFANNFDNDELKDAVEYAHLYGVKIYITANTLIYENEIANFKEYIKFLVSIGVDALIMQDIGMAHWAINSFDIPIHSSTQMHNYSLSNIEYLKSNGFSRAVLARESRLAEIHQMSMILETEVFAHGALCICYSGQCLFSAFEHNRSGNRGRCAQACRMKYSLYVDDELLIKDKYLLSPKDLALLEDTREIIKAGAASIKLEGRMKSPEYVGFVTKKYRAIIDNQRKATQEDTNTLKSLFNRGFTKGYAFGLDNQTLIALDRPNHAGIYIGDVMLTSKEFITIKLHKSLNQGDGIKFDRADKGFVCNKIYYKGKLVSQGEAEQTIQLDNKINLRLNDRLLLTKDTNLLKTLSSYRKKEIPIKVKGEFYIKKPATITISDNNGNTVTCQGVTIEQSKNAPLSEDNIIKSLSKFGESPYFAEKIQIAMDDNIFISKSNINKLRRDAVELLNAKRTAPIKYITNDYYINHSAPLPSPNYISTTVRNEEQLLAVLEYDVDRIYVADFNLYKQYKSQHKNIYYFLDSINSNTENFQNERLVIRDTGGIKYAQNNDVIADYMLNITNSQSLAHLHMNNLKSACLSVELDRENSKALSDNYRQSYGCYPNAEMLIYGRIQLMTTKHCMLDGNIECGMCKTVDIHIEDIHGNAFPIITDDKCNNLIYSRKPIDKIQSMEYYKSAGINGFRLDFLKETPNDIQAILNKIQV